MKNYILLTTILMGVSKTTIGAAAGGAGAEEVSKPQVQLVANGPNSLLEADKISIDGGDVAIEGDKVIVKDLLIKATDSIDIRSSGAVTLGDTVPSSKSANKS